MVQLIKVCDRTLVVGVTSGKIDLLTELSEEEIPFQEQVPEKTGGKSGFSEVLNLRPRRKAAADGVTESPREKKKTSHAEAL
jgi:flagellar biogenesis protein FliO